MHAGRTWGRRLLATRYSVLFVVLMADLSLGPLLAWLVPVPRLLAVLVVGSVAWTLRDRRGVGSLLMVLGLVALATDLGGARPALRAASYAVVVGVGAASILVDLVQRPMARTEAVAGGMALYLLLGMAFGGVYALLLTSDPAALVYDAATMSPEVAAVYFSFVTLTTVGYGDVLPGNALVRSLALSEAVVGVLFVAVILARTLSAPDETDAGGGP